MVRPAPPNRGWHLLADEAGWRFRAWIDSDAGPWWDDPCDAAAPFCGRWVNVPWPTHWQAFGPLDPADGQAVPEFEAGRTPSRLRIGQRIYPAGTVRANERGVIDLALQLGHASKAVAWLIACRTSEADEQLVVHAGADWWMQWQLDGSCVYRTPAGGNLHPVGRQAHPFAITLTRGVHRLAVQVTAGTAGWSLASEAVRCVVPPTDPRPIEIEGRREFTTRSFPPLASLTLEGDANTRLNGHECQPPLAGMRYAAIPGIRTTVLGTKVNELTRRWSVDPSEAGTRLAPLRVFATSGEHGRIAPAARLWGIEPGAARVIAGPVIAPDANGALTITCTTDADAAVELSLEGSPPKRSSSGIIHQFTIDSGSTPFRYSIRAADTSEASGWTALVNARRDGDRHRIAVASDGGLLPEVWRQIARRIEQHAPDLLIFVGDHVSRGREERLWRDDFINPARRLLASTPMLPVPGNHDHNAPLMKALWPVFDHRNHWTRSIGSARLIGLDGAAPWTAGGPDVDWLESVLANDTSPFVFVFNHYPAYSSGVHTRIGADGRPDEPAVCAARNVILPILQRHRTTALFSGHDHGYERFRTPPPTLLIVAGAGAYLYADHSDQREGNPVRACRSASHHFALIDLSPQSANLTVLDRSGCMIDQAVWSPRFSAHPPLTEAAT